MQADHLAATALCRSKETLRVRPVPIWRSGDTGSVRPVTLETQIMARGRDVSGRGGFADEEIDAISALAAPAGGTPVVLGRRVPSTTR
jgi:hypothetical protein